MTKFVETAKKYDRSIVAVITGIGILVATYLGIGSKIDAMVKRSQPMVDIERKVELNEKLQEQTNIFIFNKLDNMDKKLDIILRQR